MSTRLTKTKNGGHHYLPFSNMRSSKAFTLIELLIVIGILAVLSAAVILIINPTETLQRSQDSRRLSELNDINRALQIGAARGITDFGEANKVYISLPDDSSPTSTCPSYSLPSLPTGWSYQCSSSANYKKVNGSGWAPVDFTPLATGAPFSVLPIDPINTPASGFYYTYTVSGNSWELTSILKTTEYQQRYASNDGGQSDTAAEIGTKLKITPLATVSRGDMCPSGPQTNYNISNITNKGFALCWSQTFGNSGSSIDAACAKDNLFLACRQVAATTATVAACGKRSVVLNKNVTCLSGTTRPATDFPIDNNVRWYNNSCSFGWVDTQATEIRQYSCNYGVDSAAGGLYGANQMCRHGASTAPSSGWSCGNTSGLNSNNSWTLEVYQK